MLFQWAVSQQQQTAAGGLVCDCMPVLACSGVLLCFSAVIRAAADSSMCSSFPTTSPATVLYCADPYYVVTSSCACLQDIIGRFPDLMEGFNRFLARCETMDAVDNEMRGQFGSQRGISQREMARLKGVSAR